MRTIERVKSLGEVFTPQWLVERILNKIPADVLNDCSKTVIDNSCGNGQFLVEIAKRRSLASGKPLEDILPAIYGVDISELNVLECRARLLMGHTSTKLKCIVERNIICADALVKNHPGWDDVGYMWDEEDLKRKQLLVGLGL